MIPMSSTQAETPPTCIQGWSFHPGAVIYKCTGWQNHPGDHIYQVGDNAYVHRPRSALDVPVFPPPGSAAETWYAMAVELQTRLDELRKAASAVYPLPGETLPVALRRRLTQFHAWQTMITDLDRCPHLRHEGDDCSGWRGPGDYDGGCKGGRSLGNPLMPRGQTIGWIFRDRDNAVYQVPNDQRERLDPEAWKVSTPISPPEPTEPETQA